MIDLSHPILLLPEIFLVCMTCLTLLVDLFISQKQSSITYFFVQLTLVVTTLLVVFLSNQPSSVMLNGSFIWDPIAAILKIFILGISVFVFVFSRNFIRERPIPQGEYYILGLFSILGMLILVSAYNFLSIFLGLELMSLPLYAMVAIERDSITGTEGAIKYFVTGALATSMLLYGMSMTYGALHTINISEIATKGLAAPGEYQLLLIFSLVFILSGIAFKLGAAPFHMWIPDVYQGAPTSVTMFLGSAPKIAALGMAIRLIIESFPGLLIQWQEVLIVIAILSIAIGNIVAIVQTNLKRLLAYSAIAHVGYMTLGLLAGTPLGYSAALFYMIIYAIMSLGGFAILVLLSRSGLEAENIEDLRGLNARNPWLAFMMLLVMFSMAGVPPLVGFFAKVGVLLALIAVNKVWLATFALVFAIIGAYYYLNVVKVMYFEEPHDQTVVTIPLDMRLAISVNGLVLLLLGMFPSGLIQACRSAFSLMT